MRQLTKRDLQRHASATPAMPSPAALTAACAALLAPMPERRGQLSPRPSGRKGVRRSGIIAAVITLQRFFSISFSTVRIAGSSSSTVSSIPELGVSAGLALQCRSITV